jgi:hypothetical protein
MQDGISEKIMKGRQVISSEEALEIVLRKSPLIDFHIVGKLNLTIVADKIGDLIVQNCYVEKLESEAVNFNGKVQFENSEFESCSFSFAYFNQGFSIQRCVFRTYLDFQCGGHNSLNNWITIKNTTFSDFVNFFDCIYNGPVEISQNDFQKGSNLLGNLNQSFNVQFDIIPLIEGNKGRLNIDGEGDLKMNVVVW